MTTMTTPLTVRNLTEAWVCYEIRIPAHVGPFYIGATTLANVRHLYDAKENSEWRKLMDASATIDKLTILAISTDQHLIEQMRDVIGTTAWCNPRHDPTATESLTGRRVRCIQDGTIYQNASHVARTLNVSRQSISQHLSGGSPARVRGMTFERIA